MPFKIGRTKNAPERRIKETGRTNKETYVKIVDYFSKYHHFMERILHNYFRNARITRLGIQDGKTEWFLLTEREVTDGARKIKIALQMICGDEINPS
jgi:ribosomal protein L2